MPPCGVALLVLVALAELAVTVHVMLWVMVSRTVVAASAVGVDVVAMFGVV